MNKLISSEMAAYLIKDGAVVVPGGFGCCGHPEAITKAIARRYAQTGMPRNLTLLFAAGSGDANSQGLNRLNAPGLVTKAYGGYWGFIPKLAQAAIKGDIQAHNWPQGVISKLYRCIASGDPGLVSEIGLGTFIDPSQESGCINSKTKPEVELIKFKGKEKLFYPSIPIDFAYLRATMADRYGNLSMDEEVSLQDTLAQAQAAHNSGGIVVAQVKRFCGHGKLDPLTVKIPGGLVDYVVLSEDEADHQQTYANAFNPNFTRSESRDAAVSNDEYSDARALVARRAARELQNTEFKRTPIINLGIGIPAEIGRFGLKKGVGQPVLTVEGGAFGGYPAYGLSFGASEYPDAIIDQNSLFDLYDGGGIDMAFLGFAQVDRNGNVNVSKYSGNLKGVGGFVNISQSAKHVVFCGTLTSGGLQVEVDRERGELNIVKEGRFRKFINSIEQISFNGLRSQSEGRPVKVITERAVFELEDGELALSEVVAGIDIKRDIEMMVGFPLKVSRKGIQVVPV